MHVTKYLINLQKHTVKLNLTDGLARGVRVRVHCPNIKSIKKHQFVLLQFIEHIPGRRDNHRIQGVFLKSKCQIESSTSAHRLACTFNLNVGRVM